MDEHLILRNRLKTVRKEKKLSQTELAELVGIQLVLLKLDNLIQQQNWH